MRDKFSELIKQGVAEFNYTPISKNVPEADPICRMYNNIFSIPTDTHMSITDNGDRVITGHMINTANWENFCSSCFCCSFLFSHFNSPFFIRMREESFQHLNEVWELRV